MPTQTFDCTPIQLAALRTALAAQNVVVPAGDKGTLSGADIDATFDYDGAAKLTITIFSKPWWMPASSIFSTIQEHIGS